MWDVIDLSRWQFALTALYHFLFVPLTLGLIFLLAIMETIYVVTGKTIYRDMTRFWGKLFGINFALGVATGLTMEFQFGTNWSFYSNYVGDIFGAPLAMEALMAFFLESTFVGLFFFGWQRLNKYQHLLVTWLVAFGSNLSALWILNANGWMQYPTGAHFDIDTLRMEMTSFSELVFNPVSQVKFVHTVMAGYVTGAMFIMAISAWYLLRGRERDVALRSFAIGSVFGTLAIIGTLQLGDSSAYEVAQVQPVKLAAMEGEWQTEPAPAPFHVVAWPEQDQERNAFAIKIPALLGILATHSLDKPVPGLKNLMAETYPRLQRGRMAWLLMQEISQGNREPHVLQAFRELEGDLGYGMLLSRYAPDMNHVTAAQYQAAMRGAIPQVAPVFWSFRIMVGCGSLLLLVMLIALVQTLRGKIDQHRWVLKMALWSLPLPWIAIEAGWFMTEFGRQPWAIQDILPTYSAHSALTTGQLAFSLIMIVGLYTLFLIAEVYLMQAEAWNEYLDQPDSRVYDPLDKVRERAGILPVREAWKTFSNSPAKVDTKVGMREIIRNEYSIEFAFEGHRYWDIRRWTIAHQVMNEKQYGWNILGTTFQTFYNNENGPIVVWSKNKFVAPRDYLEPFNAEEILISGMVQNPGW